MDYKSLRKISPEAARQAVLQYLSTNGSNIHSCAKFFGIQRVSVYDIIRKSKQGDLTDRSKAPKTVGNKTPLEMERKILLAKEKTGYGAVALSRYLIEQGLKISLGTLRGILRRNSIKA